MSPYPLNLNINPPLIYYDYIYLFIYCGVLWQTSVSCFMILIWQVYFWTGSPALPASEEGFQPMPSVTIRPADDSHLPTANTCISRLYIPLYTTRAILRSKLLLAIKTKNFGFVWKKWPKDRENLSRTMCDTSKLDEHFLYIENGLGEKPYSIGSSVVKVCGMQFFYVLMLQRFYIITILVIITIIIFILHPVSCRYRFGRIVTMM